MDRPLTVVLMIALVTSACGPRSQPLVGLVTATDGRSTAVEARSESGAAMFVRRIDGNVQTVYRDRLTADREQLVVVTGLAGGSDQASVLVLEESGDLLTRYRVSGDVPPAHGETDRRRRLVGPDVSGVRPALHRGRRLVAITTGGITGDCGLELLEAEDERTLSPRFRFWNQGVIRPVTMGDGLIATRALANAFRPGGEPTTTYPVAIVVISIDAALDADGANGVSEGVAPSPTRPGCGFLRYYLLPEASRPGSRMEHAVSIEGRIVRVVSTDGLTYLLDSASRAVRVLADDALRARTEAGAGPLADLEGDIAERLVEYAARVRVFPETPPK